MDLENHARDVMFCLSQSGVIQRDDELHRLFAELLRADQAPGWNPNRHVVAMAEWLVGVCKLIKEAHTKQPVPEQIHQSTSPSPDQTHYANLRINRGSPTPQPDFSQMVNTTCARSGLKRGVRKEDPVDELATAITHACANIAQWLPHAPSLPPDTLNSVLEAYQSTESLDQLDALEFWILTMYSSAQVYQDYHGRLANHEHVIQPSPGFRNMPKDGFDYGAEYREDLVQPQPETTPTSEQPMVTFDDLYCLFCVCEQTTGTRTWDSNRVRRSELIVACYTQAAQAMGMSPDSEGKVTGSSRFSPYKMTISFDKCDGYTLTMNDVDVI